MSFIAKCVVGTIVIVMTLVVLSIVGLFSCVAGVGLVVDASRKADEARTAEGRRQERFEVMAATADHRVTIDQLAGEFATDPFAADRRYRGSVLEVVGPVATSRVDYARRSAVLTLRRGTFAVDCEFTLDMREPLSAMGYGTQIRVRGRYAGHDPFSLFGCITVSGDPLK